MVVLDKINIPLSNPTPNDIVFVVEGTALCGAYLNELKQAYILPTLEYFNGGPLDEKDCGSVSSYNVYGLVVFHAADILPGYLTEAYGPLTTPHKLITTLEKIQFAGGYGEAASHVGEGLATAMQCLNDITNFRSPLPEIPTKKHVILICNCKPYGLPVMESVGTDGVYRGMTAEQLAAQMMERGVHLSILSPRKIPALISLFDRGGGESSTQKTYARDPRHLVLLNGFHLQERPITPKQAPEVPAPAALNPPPAISQPQPPPPPVPTSAPQSMPHPPQQQQQQQQQSQQQPPQTQPQPQIPPPVSMPQSQPPQQQPPVPTSQVQVQTSQAPIMSTATSMSTMQQQSNMPPTVSMAGSMGQNMGPGGGMIQPPTSMGMNQPQVPTSMASMGMNQAQPATSMGMNQAQPPTSMGMNQPPTSMGINQPPTSMGMSQAPSSMGINQPPTSMGMNQPPTSMGMSMSQPPTSMGMGMNPMQQQQQQQQQGMTPQQMIMIRNRAGTPMQIQGIRQMQMNPNQINPNQPFNPNQMGPNANQPPMSSSQPMSQANTGQMINPQQQMHPNQQQISLNQQMNPQLSQQLQQKQQQLSQAGPMGQQFGNQPGGMGQQIQGQQMGQQLGPGQPLSATLLGPRMMTQQLSQSGPMGMQQQQPGQQPQQGQPGQPQLPGQNMPRWGANPMSTASTMQSRLPSQVPLVRMTNVNQPQVPNAPSLQAQMNAQQPIVSSQIQPSTLQQQLQQTPQQPQQAQQNSPLLTQLKNPPQLPPTSGPPGQPGLFQQINNSPVPQSQQPQPQQQKERQIIWSGFLEWQEKPKGPPDAQKIPRQVPCKVSATVIDGVPEVKGDGWPQKLIMQLIPKNIVGNLGGNFLVRDVTTVVFMLQNCDALNNLTRIMDSGYAGCVHFTGAQMQQPACAIKVLILLYSKERQTYLGFIPKDQVGFVDRIRKVIQQQKQQQSTRQGQVFPGAGGLPQQPGMMPQQPGMVQGLQQGMVQGQQQGIVQQQQGGMMQGQQVSSLAQQLGQTPQGALSQSPVTALVQQLGQAEQLQQQLQQQQQQQIQNSNSQGGMDQDINQIEMERQRNLLTIQQLQQTLQAAQQKELQFQQLQQHPVSGPGGHQQPGPGQIVGQVQVGQQQILQPGQQQQLQQVQRPIMAQQIGQMRMMRSASVSQANPGLKHLLQQQPGPQNYRMQMPMQQQRLQGQMQMPGQMQGGPMQPNQQM